MRYLIIAAVVGITTACGVLLSRSDAYLPVDAPAHHTASGFKNLYIDDEKKPGWFTFWTKVKFSGDWPDEDESRANPPVETITPDLDKIHNPDPTKLQTTWIGHSTVLVQYNGINIITDPVFSNRVSPVSFAGPVRYTQPALTMEQLPNIDVVVISHNHYDHLDIPTIQQLGNNPLWLVPLKNTPLFHEVGVTNVKELDWWEDHIYSKDGKDLKVTLTPNQHWSARGLFDRSTMLWGAWAFHFDKRAEEKSLLQTVLGTDSGENHIEGPSIWFGGDTGYNEVQFKEIGEKLGPFDLGLIPIGAYGPRWFMRNNHVNPAEAVTIHQEIGAQKSVGVHWGAFILTNEPVDEPPQSLKEALVDQKLPTDEFITTKLGEVMYTPLLDRPAKTATQTEDLAATE